ncbi:MULTISPECIES: hypothetical protein [Streptomyces]|uniref:Uncharacterized protein n=1 Tax=Streptomyces dengpaensis TaxID=2049881 RepID=A0ABM6SZR5_9ACTN|nr:MULTISPECIES: hypothetical protein [Streptomyces]AVH59953.1 hypothetical protein C4B68_33930 [Streptomyces dengpaensis]PIB09588.1 hypothetical protein B1C81_10605 [Streptomyces sp. HG99]
MTRDERELRTAAQTLRDVAPDITGRLAGLADPVADWLDKTADHCRAEYLCCDYGSCSEVTPALAVARAINGGQP